MLDNSQEFYLFILTEALEIGLISLNELSVRSNKDKCCEWGFSRELQDKSNNDNSLKMRLSESLKSISILPVAATLLVSTANMVAR